MRNEFLKQLDLSNEIHIPLPIDENETAEARLKQKPVLESRLLDNMDSLDNFIAITDHVKLEITKERFISGNSCLKMSCPTNLDNWDTDRGHGIGRIYDIPSAYRKIDNEDWTNFNRISFWIYPECNGIKSISFRVQIHNDGEHKVPDIHMREGGHNINLNPDCWNHIVLEIPYLARDKVIGISFDYDMVGHEPDAVDHCSWYIDKLELQKVNCDIYEGWIPANDRIVYSHSGYQTGSTKTAIAADINADTFKLIETKSGKVVLEKKIIRSDSKLGSLQIMDFTEIMEQGDYIIVAGGLSTRVFAISNDVWETSIWKMLNFFLVLRCGYEVPGKHLACHSDMLLKHGDKSIVANGGWHDAGDLAQGMTNTCEATTALFALAKTLKDKNDRLYKRVLEEAKWGLDYVMKTRFGDGYRASYSSCSIWTDGVIGSNDDVVSVATYSAYINFDAAYAMLLGASELEGSYATYALKLAKEDYALAKERLDQIANEQVGQSAKFEVCRGDYIEVQVCSIAALSAIELYKLTGEESYKTDALLFSKRVLACQQQEYTDWETPMIGFYYESSDKKLIWHHNHMAYAYLPNLAFENLCNTFTDNELYIEWYNALVLSGIYYKDIVKYTSPYNVIPSGIYHQDEADMLELLISNHPILAGDPEKEIAQGYKNLVQKGFPLGNGYYLRVYPVWFSFRGNYNVILSDGKAVGSACNITNDIDLYNIEQQQFSWIVGKNPTAQSTMYGEGYDYVQLYAVQPGQTVGAISVGMQSNGDNDEPFWPQVNNATYKEVWVCSATKWMWGMSDHCLPAKVCGCLKAYGETTIAFTHNQTNKQYTTSVNQRTGWFEILLPTGKYTATYGGATKTLTAISGKEIAIDGELYELTTTYKNSGDKLSITITLTGHYPISLSYNSYNLTELTAPTSITPQNGTATITIETTIQNSNKPAIFTAIPNNNYADRTEIII